MTTTDRELAGELHDPSQLAPQALNQPNSTVNPDPEKSPHPTEAELKAQARTFDISHSDISSFLQCRRQFWFSYVLGFSDNRFPVGAASAGTRVHTALESLYPTPPEPPRDPKEVFEEIARSDIATASSPHPLTGQTQPPWVMDKLYDDILLGRRMVADYMDHLAEHNPDAEWLPVMTEAKLRYTIQFDDPVWSLLDDAATVSARTQRLQDQGFTAIRLQGKVDLVQQHASTDPTLQHDTSDPRRGQLRMTDWKTTGRTFQVDEGFARSNQSYFYDMLAEMAQDVPLPFFEARARSIIFEAPPPEFNYRVIQRPRSRNAKADIRDLPITHSPSMRKSRRRQIFGVIADLIDTTLALDSPHPHHKLQPADSTNPVHPVERHAPPYSSDACGWCDYRTACDITDDGPTLAIAMLSTNPDFITGRRHARYATDPSAPSAPSAPTS